MLYLVDTNACSIHVCDGNSSIISSKGGNNENGVNRTGLFLLNIFTSQYYISPTNDDKLILAWIAQNRHLGKYFHYMNLHHRAEEVISVRLERDVEDFGNGLVSFEGGTRLGKIETPCRFLVDKR